MEKKPDWTKAPDWATHWGISHLADQPVWLNKDIFSYCNKGVSKYETFNFRNALGIPEFEVYSLTARPKQATPAPVDPAPPSMVAKYQIAGGEWSYSELRNNGWTDEQLIHQPLVWRENKPVEPILVPTQPKKSDFTEKEWSLMTDNNQPINLSTAPNVPYCPSWNAAPAWANHWCDGVYLRKSPGDGKFYCDEYDYPMQRFDVGNKPLIIRPITRKSIDNEPKRIYYIAGPMSGIENFNRDEFNKKADELRAAGHVVLNPATLPDGLTQQQYMDICIAMLRCATTVVMLRGWDDSRGAYAERAVALKLGIAVEYD